METITHGGTIKSDSGRDGYVWLKCDAHNLPDNTAGKIGWHVCYPQYDLDKFAPGIQAAIREHINAVYEAATKPRRLVAKTQPDPLAEHDALMREMDRPDSIM